MIQIMSYILDCKRNTAVQSIISAFAGCGRRKKLYLSSARALRSGVTITWWRFYCAFSDVSAALYTTSDEELRWRGHTFSGGNGRAEPIHLISRKLWLGSMTCNDARKPRGCHVASRGFPTSPLACTCLARYQSSIDGITFIAQRCR